MRIIFNGVSKSDADKMSVGRFITPDRAKRSAGGENSGELFAADAARELFTDDIDIMWLADGRPCITEMAVVDGFTLFYAYFDVKGLEAATTAELDEFLRRSGFDWGQNETRIHLASCKTLDAQQRPIWEFQVTYY